MKIKAKLVMWAVSVFLVFFLVSCAANLEIRKNQEAL
jgi:hypothetical protein